MRIDTGLIIGIALEFVIMLYFANSTLQRECVIISVKLISL